MSMEEFADFTEKVEEESLTSRERMEEEESLNQQFQEENFIPEDFLPFDWHILYLKKEVKYLWEP